MDNRGMFIGLWRITQGDPCETGCPRFNCGTCNGYKKVAHAKSNVKQSPFSHQTNKQIADKFGISKRQVSKLRKSGQLNEFIDNHKIRGV